MKKIITLLIAIFCFHYSQSQIATCKFSDEVPESVSTTTSAVFNPEFNNSFVYFMAHGFTTFKQTEELFSIDSKDLSIKKKIKYPDFDGYKGQTVITKQLKKYWGYETDKDMAYEWRWKLFAMKKNMVLLYSKKITKEEYMVSALKVNQELEYTQQPQPLFHCWNTKGLKVNVNDSKDICVFSYVLDSKKKNRKALYYYVYNNNLELIKCDSAITTFEKPELTKVLVYDKGYAVIRNKELISVVSLYDVMAGTKTELEITNPKSEVDVVNIKTLKDGNKVIIGSYQIPQKDDRAAFGTFKVIFNDKTKSISGKTFSDPVVYDVYDKYGVNELEINASLITENGDIFFEVCRYHSGNMSVSCNDFALIGMNKDGMNWTRPITSPFHKDGAARVVMSEVNGNLFMVIGSSEAEDCSQIDFNKFDKNKIKTDKSELADAIVLKVDPNGQISSELFKNASYESVVANGYDVIGVHKWSRVGGPVSPCKFMRISLNQ